MPQVELETEVARRHRYERELDNIRRDPVDLLRRSLAASRKVRHFTAKFCRQERLGMLFESLRPVEHMQVNFRSDPFSVRFTWLDEDSEFTQCCYVQGENGDQVVLMPRKGLFGLSAKEVRYPVDYAVKFARCKSPVTDFGPARMMERTLRRVEDARRFGGPQITVRPLTHYGAERVPCYYLEIFYPEQDGFKPKLHDVYIDAETLLPAAAYLWLPAGKGLPPRSNRTLDAMYAYGDVQTRVEFQDADFALDSGGLPRCPINSGANAK